jgi:CelD/BcsL family acetyltransferase involved in cellulose biosynthesis
MRTVGLQAKVFTEGRSISSLAGEWQALFSRCPGATTFQRSEWVLNWIDVFKPARPFVIAVWQESTLVGIAPLLIYPKNGQSVLAFAGGGVSDYLDVLIDPLRAENALAAIFDVIRAHKPSFDRIELTDLPNTSVLLNRNCSFEIDAHDICAVLDLPSSLDGLSSLVPSHKLRNFRNSRRRMAEAGKFQVDIADEFNRDEALSNLFRIHSSRWEHVGRPGVLARNEVQQFHQAVASQLINDGVLRLYMLRLNSQVIAMLYAFFEADAVYCYLQGYDPAHCKLSPGTFLLGSVIEDAIRHGTRRIDFLRGQESYKLSWGAREVSTFFAHIPASKL